jgi:hypothetical protein
MVVLRFAQHNAGVLRFAQNDNAFVDWVGKDTGNSNREADFSAAPLTKNVIGFGRNDGLVVMRGERTTARATTGPSTS